MSRSKPLPPADQKRFMGPEEVSHVETLVVFISDIIQAENEMYKKESIASPKSFALLILQLQLFMDEYLGEKVRGLQGHYYQWQAVH